MVPVKLYNLALALVLRKLIYWPPLLLCTAGKGKIYNIYIGSRDKLLRVCACKFYYRRISSGLAQVRGLFERVFGLCPLYKLLLCPQELK